MAAAGLGNGLAAASSGGDEGALGGGHGKEVGLVVNSDGTSNTDGDLHSADDVLAALAKDLAVVVVVDLKGAESAVLAEALFDVSATKFHGTGEVAEVSLEREEAELAGLEIVKNFGIGEMGVGSCLSRGGLSRGGVSSLSVGSSRGEDARSAHLEKEK